VDLVRDLMRDNDLVACQPRPFRGSSELSVGEVLGGVGVLIVV
jgi:hypothetical protein